MKNADCHIIQLQREVALNRDKRSYEKLFILLYKRMTRFAVTIVRSREAAEEVYSNVLLKLWDMGPALGSIDNRRCARD